MSKAKLEEIEKLLSKIDCGPGYCEWDETCRNHKLVNNVKTILKIKHEPYKGERMPISLKVAEE